MKRCFVLFACAVSCAVGAAALVACHSRSAHRKASVNEPGAPSKTVWEPLNYPADVALTSVFFVNDDLGWISGGANWDTGGFILQTRDGGGHWTAQLGDPKSSAPSISHLRFLDATHGWALQNNTLLRTSDGANWEDAGTLPPFVPFEDYAFTSATRGIFVGGYSTEGSKIFTTNDGGRTWNPAFQCSTTIETNGLTRETGCHLFGLSFPSASVGYAVGGSFNEGPGEGFFVVAKTTDGGNTWRIVSNVTNAGHGERVCFTSPTTGVTRNSDGRFYYTVDGGATWKGATGSHDGGHPHPIAFAGPRLGWTVDEYNLEYTTDGGLHWDGQVMKLPARIQDFSLASGRRGYVVGEHGMIYRYGIVPAAYQASGAFEAPAMPAPR